MRCLLLLAVVFVAASCASEPVEVQPPVPEVTAPSQPVEPVEVPESPSGPAEIPEEPSELAVKDDFVYPFIGDADAPVTVVQYADFTTFAGYDVAFVQIPALKRDYVLKDKVKLVFKPVPSEKYESVLAARASLCAWRQGSKQFWAFYDVLFRFYGSIDGESVLNYASRVPNIDRDAFSGCVASESYSAEMAASADEAAALGIVKLPAFTVGDALLMDDISYKRLSSEVEVRLSGENGLTGSAVYEGHFPVSLGSLFDAFLGWLGGQ